MFAQFGSVYRRACLPPRKSWKPEKERMHETRNVLKKCMSINPAALKITARNTTNKKIKAKVLLTGKLSKKGSLHITVLSAFSADWPLMGPFAWLTTDDTVGRSSVIHHPPRARRCVLSWSSCNRGRIVRSATMPAAARIPTCRIPPPSALRTRATLFRKPWAQSRLKAARSLKQLAEQLNLCYALLYVTLDSQTTYRCTNSFGPATRDPAGQAKPLKRRDKFGPSTIYLGFTFIAH